MNCVDLYYTCTPCKNCVQHLKENNGFGNVQYQLQQIMAQAEGGMRL